MILLLLFFVLSLSLFDIKMNCHILTDGTVPINLIITPFLWKDGFLLHCKDVKRQFSHKKSGDCRYYLKHKVFPLPYNFNNRQQPTPYFIYISIYN